MNCTVEQRNGVRALAAAIDTHPAVEAADVLAPDASASHSWELEVTIARDAVPPAVAKMIGRHGLWMRDVSQRGETHTTIFVRP